MSIEYGFVIKNEMFLVELPEDYKLPLRLVLYADLIINITEERIIKHKFFPEPSGETITFLVGMLAAYRYMNHGLSNIEDKLGFAITP